MQVGLSFEAVSEDRERRFERRGTEIVQTGAALGGQPQSPRVKQPETAADGSSKSGSSATLASSSALAIIECKNFE